MNNLIKNPTVVLLMDGFGLSSNWQGNAIASAKPANFFDLWENYNHLVIHSLKSENPYEGYTAVMTGEQYLAGTSLHNIDEDSFSKSKEFISAIDSVRRNNASFHLLGTISKNDSSKSIVNLLKIVKYCKKNLLTNIYVHLIIDQSFEDFKEVDILLANIQSALLSFDVSVVDIVGLEFLTDQGIDKNIESIFAHNGQQFLTLNQSISKNKKAERPSLLPLSIIETKDNSKIKDFDIIFFFGPVTKIFSIFIEQVLVLNKAKSLPNKPMSLQFFCNHSYPFRFFEGLNIISERKTEKFLTIDNAKHNKKQLLITDQENVPYINFYLLGDPSLVEEKIVQTKINPISRKNLSTTEEIFELVFQVASQNKYDLIFINLPSLYRFCQDGSFSECVEEINLIDKFLPKLAELFLDGNLLIMSAFGGAESMVANKKNIGDNKRGQDGMQSLPLLLVSKKTKKINKTDLMHEILESRENLTFVSKVFKKIIS